MKQTFRRSVARFVLLALAVLVCTLPVLAQQTLGSLNGTVVDPSGAAVVGVTVTATDACHQCNRGPPPTGSTGFFQIFNLPVGTYSVSVSGSGFEVTKLTAIPVQEARATTVNATLKVGQASESVTVTAIPLLNATDTTNGYTLDASQIEITPLATGSFTQLAVLSPGVNAELLSNLDTNSGLGNQPIWANGQRACIEHLPVEWRRLHQYFQWHELFRLQLAARTASTLAKTPCTMGGSSLQNRHIGLRVQTATACLRRRRQFLQETTRQHFDV